MICGFCKYCYINGKRENQDRGLKCETVYNVLYKENNKLKELLKECRGSVEACLWNARLCESYADTEYFKGLIAKIDEVLR